MIKVDTKCTWNYEMPLEVFGWNKNDVFLDIETTGLSWRRSHLYLIGAVFYDHEKDCLILRQWFLDQPANEKELLLDLLGFLHAKRLIQYNGNSFDLPYLSHKFDFYQLENPVKSALSLDLYQKLRPYQKLFGLFAMRQKDMETLVGFQRKDTFSGGELVPVYQSYLQSGDQKLLSALLTHNKEDLTGMLSLFPLLAVPALADGAFTVEHAICSDKQLILSLIPDVPIFFPFSVSGTFCTLKATPEHCTLTIPARTAVLKYYFSDYRQYYYLPEEDIAIHKSVGAYVDPHHREKAKASNCYQKKEGIFFPQTEPVFSPCFYEHYKGFPCYFQWEDPLVSQKKLQHQYSLLMLQYLFQNDVSVYSFLSGDLES
ncbi:MAG: ribonuclease H-like domain-containing protein [Fusicatenibacter sp.]|nr:ribonuclease H-like domain-containing protein [Fusicatenibacter sp.]